MAYENMALANSDGFTAGTNFALMPDGFEPSSTQMDAWHNPRQNMCTANDNTCRGISTKKTRDSAAPLCAGHSRASSEAKAEPKVEE